MKDTEKCEFFDNEDKALAVLALHGTLPGLKFSAEESVELDATLREKIYTHTPHILRDFQSKKHVQPLLF